MGLKTVVLQLKFQKHRETQCLCRDLLEVYCALQCSGTGTNSTPVKFPKMEGSDLLYIILEKRTGGHKTGQGRLDVL